MYSLPLRQQITNKEQDPSVLGNFIENHDLPRWRNATVDPQLGYNAMVAQFMFDGIPIVY
jgi:alpha-amylase